MTFLHAQSHLAPLAPHAKPALLAGLCLLPLLLAGCLQRTITVTSEPQGAVVWINDNEVGRTPVDVDFTYFGKYSVRLRREGYEPVIDVRTTRPPVQELPVIDLAAEAIPANFHHRIAWHYDLVPALELRVSPAQAEQTVLNSGKQLRARLAGIDESATPAP